MKRSSLLLGVALSLVSMGALAGAKAAPADKDKAATTAPAKAKTSKKAPAKKATPKPSNDNG